MCSRTWCDCGAPFAASRSRRSLANLVDADRHLAGAPVAAFKNSATTIKPQHAIQRLYELTKGRDIYITTEVGQHQMWAAQHFGFEAPNRCMTSGGLGTMGYGLPAAIGVQIAHPSRSSSTLPASLHPDEHAGNVDGGAAPPAGQGLHPQQRLHGNGPPMAGAAARRPLFRELYRALPDFVKLAEAYGAHGIRCSDRRSSTRRSSR